MKELKQDLRPLGKELEEKEAGGGRGRKKRQMQSFKTAFLSWFPAFSGFDASLCCLLLCNLCPHPSEIEYFWC